MDQTASVSAERARSNVSGAQCETITSLPFGDGMSTAGSCADVTPLHFTGKQRDSESGLDYFGARYFSSNVARFMSPDWAAKPTTVPYANFGDPQSLDLYGYVRDNPLTSTDADGHWPTSIHNLIYKNALPNLTPAQLQTIDQASHAVDFCLQCQGTSNAYQHGMRAPGQSVAEASKEAAAFVQQHESAARQDQLAYERAGGKGLSSAALKEFGTAAHTVSDETSPAHAGFQVWHNPVMHPIDAIKHRQEESTINSAQMKAAVSAVQNAFKQTFGQNALRRVVRQ